MTIVPIQIRIAGNALSIAIMCRQPVKNSTLCTMTRIHPNSLFGRFSYSLTHNTRQIPKNKYTSGALFDDMYMFISSPTMVCWLRMNKNSSELPIGDSTKNRPRIQSLFSVLFIILRICITCLHHNDFGIFM